MKIKMITFIIILVSFMINQSSNSTECPVENSNNINSRIFVQADDSAPPFGPRGQFQKGKGNNFKRFEKFRQRKLLELLELNEDQKENLQPIMEKMRFEGRQLMIDKIELTDNLSSELKQENPDEQKINEFIDQIFLLNEKHEQMRNKLHTEVKQILTLIQFGKFIIFEERFHKQAMEKVFNGQHRMGFGPDSGSFKRGRNK